MSSSTDWRFLSQELLQAPPPPLLTNTTHSLLRYTPPGISNPRTSHSEERGGRAGMEGTCRGAQLDDQFVLLAVSAGVRMVSLGFQDMYVCVGEMCILFLS